MSENQSRRREQGMEKFFFRASAADFRKIPMNPIAYWASDAVFSSLRVWQDVNQDGVSQAGELKTLSTLGISSINTSASITGGQNQNNGNVIIGSSSFERLDGSTNTSGALNFTGNTFSYLIYVHN